VSAGDHHKALVKLFQEACYRHHLHQVFADFMELIAIAFSNAFDRPQFDEREARYMQIVKRYERRELQLLPAIVGELTMAMEEAPGDVLGRLFSDLEQGNAARGQFFTPFELCMLIARLTMSADQARAAIDARGFFTVQEPACGAGAMIIALALHMRDSGINYQQHMHCTAIDVDSRAVHMAYVQFTLLHIPAVLVVGNTLSLELRERWNTPAHLLGFWDSKLARGYALGSSEDAPPALAPLPSPAATTAQLDLFGALA